MADKNGLFYALKILFQVTGLFYVLLIIIQIVNGFIYSEVLIPQIDLFEYLGKYLNKVAGGLLCFIIADVFKLMINRNVHSLLLTRRILHACCLSFFLLGLVNIASGIRTFLELSRGWSMKILMTAISIGHIALVQALPIVTGIAVYMIFYSVVELIDFESEVA